MKTCENCGGLDTEESDARTNAYLAAERRERIATAICASYEARYRNDEWGHPTGTEWPATWYATDALARADALIAALDAKPVKP